MPSYRATLFVEQMAPGSEPESTLPTAVSAVNSLAKAEHYEVRLVDRRGALVVRFAAEDDRRAGGVAIAMADAVATIAVTGGLRLERRAGSLWRPIAPI